MLAQADMTVGMADGKERAQPMLDVLIAEDDSDLREMLAGCVAGLGYRVHEAADGEAALEILGTTPIDILLTDWMMPRLDGFTLCSRVRDRRVTPLRDPDDRVRPRAARGGNTGRRRRLPHQADKPRRARCPVACGLPSHSHTAAARQPERQAQARQRALPRDRPVRPAHRLGNRLALDKELRRISANAARYMSSLSIAMCDIDYFKHYNDRYGHLAGDIALKRVAATVLGRFARATWSSATAAKSSWSSFPSRA